MSSTAPHRPLAGTGASSGIGYERAVLFAINGPSRVTMSMVTHSTSACGRSSAAGWMTNEAPEQRG